MGDLPLWRHEMELPHEQDFDNVEDYEQAMNMYVHDQLYGWEEDRRAYEEAMRHEYELQHTPLTRLEDDGE